jgi:hypothetical protein
VAAEAVRDHDDMKTLIAAGHSLVQGIALLATPATGGSGAAVAALIGGAASAAQAGFSCSSSRACWLPASPSAPGSRPTSSAGLASRLPPGDRPPPARSGPANDGRQDRARTRAAVGPSGDLERPAGVLDAPPHHREADMAGPRLAGPGRVDAHAVV